MPIAPWLVWEDGECIRDLFKLAVGERIGAGGLVFTMVSPEVVFWGSGSTLVRPAASLGNQE